MISQTIQDAINEQIKHEFYSSNLYLAIKINALAISENDYTTQTFLQWFITEQIEEEKNASQIVGFLKRIGESSGSLFALDHQLSKRSK